MKKINKNTFFKKIIMPIVCVLLVVDFCLPFLAGYYSSGKTIEEISQYTSNVVINSTEKSKYLSITVGRNDNSGPILDPYLEFYNLYGTFRQEQASFGSGANFYNEHKGDKDHSVYLKDYSDNVVSKNLSLFYLGPVGSIEYNNHHKHYIYPFELMFVDGRNYEISRYLAYISKSHADSLLESLGEVKDESGKYSEAQYKSLIKKKVNISIDGETSEYVINNIYYQQNYYYSAMSEVFSDFILTSYFSPNNNQLINEKRNVYFMSEYSYQNQYYMEYINRAYSSKLFDVSINKNNVTGQIDDKHILDFYYSDLSNDSNLYTTLIILFYLLLALLLASLIVAGFDFSILSSMLLGACGFIPYITFYLLFKGTKSIDFFTKTAGLNYFVGFLILFIVIISWHFIYKYILRRNGEK